MFKLLSECVMSKASTNRRIKTLQSSGTTVIGEEEEEEEEENKQWRRSTALILTNDNNGRVIKIKLDGVRNQIRLVLEERPLLLSLTSRKLIAGHRSR
jgi:hypothetical protein